MTDYWIKLYIEILDDPKMATLPDRLWRRVIELFLCAGRVYKNGQLPDTKQLAWMMRIPTDELDLDLHQIAMTGIVEQTNYGWFIPKFEKRQGAASGAERVMHHRERQHKEQYYSNNSSNDPVTLSYEDTYTYTESDTDAESRAKSPKKPRQKAAQAAPADAAVTPLTVYRHFTRLNVPIPLKDEVTNTVTNLELWGGIVHDWIGSGWNPRNIKGMLEAYHAGGLAPRKNGKRQSNEPAGFAGIRAAMEELENGTS